MIRGVHAMFYSSAPDELRAFFRDKLGLRANDIGGGWLIFDVPEADMGVHPADTRDGPPPSSSSKAIRRRWWAWSISARSCAGASRAPTWATSRSSRMRGAA